MALYRLARKKGARSTPLAAPGQGPPLCKDSSLILTHCSDLKSPAQIFLQAAVMNMTKEDQEDFKTTDRQSSIEKSNFFKKHDPPHLVLELEGCFAMELSRDL